MGLRWHKLTVTYGVVAVMSLKGAVNLLKFYSVTTSWHMF